MALPEQSRGNGNSYIGRMTLHSFLSLEAGQRLALWARGTLIGARLGPDPGEVTFCRQVAHFYTEYVQRNGNWIHLRSFDDVELLRPYLDEIDLNGAW